MPDRWKQYPKGVLVVAAGWSLPFWFLALNVYLVMENVRFIGDNPTKFAEINLLWTFINFFLPLFFWLYLMLRLVGIVMKLIRLEEQGRYIALCFAGVWAAVLAAILIIFVGIRRDTSLSDRENVGFVSVLSSLLIYNLWTAWYLSRIRTKEKFQPALVKLNLRT